MDKKQFVFATHNANKASEIQKIVGEQHLIKTLTDIGCNEEIPETGDTLEANASIKSAYVNTQYHLNCFADDTGLEVEALNGEPGVYSARYAGDQKKDAANIELLLQNLKNVENRTAQFRTVISLIMDGKEYLFEGILKGTITYECIGNNGFGYDPIFKPLNSDITLAQMSMEEKNKISHRAKAVSKLIAFLQTH
jgi:XTP/dITP diphosphohydrolase